METDRTNTGVIFNIQKFCVNDGPGIRTAVFFKGCPLHCPWCANPESQSGKVQMVHDRKLCISCLRCMDVCPRGALRKDVDGIHIDPKRCDACGACAKVCPRHAMKCEGEVKNIAEIMEEVKKDEPFYEESGGGITLSGGEILAQADFAEALLKAAKEEGIHTCIETTGITREETFRRILAYTDTVLMDLKHWDSETHRAYTGMGNELPVRSLKLALSLGREVLPRIPVIPGFNDSLEDAKHLTALLKEAGAGKCQLLPFHQFGENKYSLLERDYAYKDVKALHAEELEAYRDVFLKNGIEAFF